MSQRQSIVHRGESERPPAHDHCDRCYTSAPSLRTERLPDLEAFLTGWCEDNGFALRFEQGTTQTIARMGKEPGDE